jgi:hypothetical protein
MFDGTGAPDVLMEAQAPLLVLGQSPVPPSARPGMSEEIALSLGPPASKNLPPVPGPLPPTPTPA